MRIFDTDTVSIAIKSLLKSEDRCDPDEWILNRDNICLQNEYGDLALFEYGVPKVMTGHYYFQSRGKKALEAGHAFLDEIFNPCYNIEVITGLTPLANLGARWLTRRLGFKSQGVVRVRGKAYEMFILTKKEFTENG